MLKAHSTTLRSTSSMPLASTQSRALRGMPAARKAVLAESAPLRLEPGPGVSKIKLPPRKSTDERVPNHVYFRAPEPNFPKILQPEATEKGTFKSWGQAVRPELDAALAQTPAVLVRGLPLRQPADFREFLDGVGYEKEDYVGSFIDRMVEDGLYNATANPDHYWLTPHNENVFYEKRPNKIIFCMVQPATEQGGETLLQTNETLTQAMSQVFIGNQNLIDHFNANDGIRYTRWYPTAEQKKANVSEAQGLLKQAKASGNDMLAQLGQFKLMTAGIMPTWQQWVKNHAPNGEKVYQDPNAARAYFENLALNVRFDEEGGLIAWNVLPATIPGKDGAPMWLNFADNDGIEPYFRITYGNGNPIPNDVRNVVKDALLSECSAMALQQGDVIFYDNIHAQHGRTPFTGSRKLLVEMSK